jgi:NADPH:quinone reductase-like Zn-dependent oxidoreductase
MNTDAQMRAVRAHSSDPASITSETLPRPAPQPGEVLVAVGATAVTSGELTWPESWPVVPGHDVSGVVHAVGTGVRRLEVGDEVYGLIGFDRPGAAADYVCVPAADLAAKPDGIDHLAAAALPLGGLTAWQALFDHADLQAGQHVLVHGGAGGVGAYAVQIAGHYGARVTATASVEDANLVRTLGADCVIDYDGRFEDQVGEVDIVIDTVGGSTLTRSWQTLRRGGILVGIAEEPSEDEAAEAGVRCAYFIVEPNREQLDDLGQLAEQGALRPAVARVLPLEELTVALTTRPTGDALGKTVIQVGA